MTEGLAGQRCEACNASTPPLDKAAIAERRGELDLRRVDLPAALRTATVVALPLIGFILMVIHFWRVRKDGFTGGL
ncbi:MAG: hypothetical protein JF886_04970 [Candidatus Dormibacteraeota bacterium]|uniref:Uncharacterized protein n=1 Tax=Candidatus Aeolococcus gillhamiae TaxID=3127015 RepID=A0A934JSH5_9BACT|nr:hypothetical protein [Candidatus Dormibacteraeota bacterium]